MNRTIASSWTYLCVTVVTFLSGVAPSYAELLPSEVAVVCVRGSKESRAVAGYYLDKRQVPEENLLTLDIPPGVEMSREDWEKARTVIRRWLSESNRLQKIRCFVTVYDVPLKIAASTDTSEQQKIIEFLQAERRIRVQQLNDFTQALGKLAGTASAAALNPEASMEDIKKHLDTVFGAAQGDIGKIADENRRGAAMQQLQAIYFQAVGMNMMMQSMQRQLQSGGASNMQLRSEFDSARGRVIGLREGRAAMEGMPFSLDREPFLLAVIQLSDGIFGSIAWIDEQIDMLGKNETYASFDSELSLVAWPKYPLIRWQPNPLHYRYDQSALREFKKTYMVSRLEGPTLKLTREMFDQALAVEQTGLTGKVYLDARGLAKADEAAAPGSYQDYDQAVLMAADLIQKNTDLEVVLDTKQELFQPGAAPDAALYCGWYSLAKYVDAFDWKPGAVGYHMASAEATVLRDPPNVETPSQVWCKRMMEDGVVATIGPVNEPYISAFPRPNEFFACLLSGKYTLVESYYRTLPFTSWTMTLIGDPLYSPFKVNAPLKMNDLDALSRRIVDGPAAFLETIGNLPAAAPAAAAPAAETPAADIPE